MSRAAMKGQVGGFDQRMTTTIFGLKHLASQNPSPALSGTLSLEGEGDITRCRS